MRAWLISCSCGIRGLVDFGGSFIWRLYYGRLLADIIIGGSESSHTCACIQEQAGQEQAMEFQLISCVGGYHVYKAIWNPNVGELFSCLREEGNSEDLYAVAVISVTIHSWQHSEIDVSCLLTSSFFKNFQKRHHDCKIAGNRAS